MVRVRWKIVFGEYRVKDTTYHNDKLFHRWFYENTCHKLPACSMNIQITMILVLDTDFWDLWFERYVYTRRSMNFIKFIEGDEYEFQQVYWRSCEYEFQQVRDSVFAIGSSMFHGCMLSIIFTRLTLSSCYLMLLLSLLNSVYVLYKLCIFYKIFVCVPSDLPSPFSIQW